MTVIDFKCPYLMRAAATSWTTFFDLEPGEAVVVDPADRAANTKPRRRRRGFVFFRSDYRIRQNGRSSFASGAEPASE
jgi:hypothetical protein